MTQLIRTAATALQCTRLLSQRALCTQNATVKSTQTVLRHRANEEKYPAAVLNALSETNGSQYEKNRLRKTEMIERFRRWDQDTGSPEVQIAILTDRIQNLTRHAIQNRQDKENTRRLLLMVNKRRSQMKYLLRKSPDRYMTIVKELGLRPSSVFSKDVSLGAKKAPRPQLH